MGPKTPIARSKNLDGKILMQGFLMLQVFMCKEDVQAFCEDKEKKVIHDDEDVERIRR